jgi:hypothetical protein
MDPIDIKILTLKQKIDQVYYKQTLPRWMTIAWDGFRIVDNNTHSVIFMLPDDPCTEDYQDYALNVENPTINLETIKQKLQYRYYTSLQEFVNEMMILFDNWVAYKGENSKMYT